MMVGGHVYSLLCGYSTWVTWLQHVSYMVVVSYIPLSTLFLILWDYKVVVVVKMPLQLLTMVLHIFYQDIREDTYHK